MIALAGVLLALPATAAAGGGGGAGLTGPPTPPTPPASGKQRPVAGPPVTSPAPVVTRPGNVTVSASGDGITVQARTSAMLRHSLTFTGTAPGDAGETVEIERRGRQTAWQWAPTTTATVGPGGAFSALWATNHIGRFSIRAVLESSLAEPAGATGMMTVTVYLPSIASWYGGPSLFGRGTACGYKLTRALVGVANKTLPCGEDVALYYRGRTLVAPVIDRGPYVNGRRYDLTYAAARALGLVRRGVATIGAVSLPSTP